MYAYLGGRSWFPETELHELSVLRVCWVHCLLFGMDGAGSELGSSFRIMYTRGDPM